MEELWNFFHEVCSQRRSHAAPGGPRIKIHSFSKTFGTLREPQAGAGFATGGLHA
jgi:hypothetical protein